MVIDGLDCRTSEEPHALSRGHSRYLVPNCGAQCVQEETLERVIVECAECVGDVEAVVARVESCWDYVSMLRDEKAWSELTVKPFVHVHSAVEEILPCIDNEDSETEL